MKGTNRHSCAVLITLIRVTGQNAVLRQVENEVVYVVVKSVPQGGGGGSCVGVWGKARCVREQGIQIRQHYRDPSLY